MTTTEPLGLPDPMSPTGDAIRDTVARVWCDVLPAGATVNDTTTFFAAGGTSLQAMALTARLEQELTVQVDLAVLFDIGSISVLTEIVRTELVGDAK